MKYEFRIEFELYPTSYGLLQGSRPKKELYKVRNLFFILTIML